MTKIKRQHFLPNFIIKRWSTKIQDKSFFNILKYNEKNSEIVEIRSQDDPFFRNYFYESNTAGFDFNEIEIKLGKIEQKYYTISENIIGNWKKYNTIRITRSDLLIIKLFMIVQMARSESQIISSNDLDGDFLFNNLMEKYSPQDIKDAQLKNLNFYYLLFESIENKQYNGNLDSILPNDEYYKSELFIRQAIRVLENFLKYTFLNFSEIDTNETNKKYILTDHGPIYAAGTITHTPLVHFYPLTPTICLSLTNKFLEENTYTEKIFHADKKIFNSNFELEDIWKRNYRVKYKDHKNGPHLDDEFIYNKNIFSERQIKVINGITKVQVKNYLIFINEQDYTDVAPSYRSEDVLK
ncbi:DUF4238 domain-containing protein [[Acholeplasma] multilocale]|uniref:DUF4238 domain-containing protein n=1 Tax=[Acholeplasma] multilocale TaxID=264638 RepID=UPI00047D408D|nr:DUF4238 domain-containing protein [[Acholeplasma] multilocale]